MSNIRFTSRISQWTSETEGKIDLSVLQMATDIHRVGSMTAPKDSRALVNSGRIDRVASGHYKIIFGGGAVPYARRRHFENQKNPGTLRYLERAGDATGRNPQRYVKNI